MKFKILFIFWLTLLVSVGHAFSQSAQEKKLQKKEAKEEKKRKKAEYKAWQARAKQYAKKPMSLKNLVKAKQESDQKASDAMEEAARLRSSVGAKDAKIKELENRAAQASDNAAALKSELGKLRAAPPSSRGEDYSKGILFKVQIGSFKSRDLSQYFKNNPNFAGEVTESGSQRITIGVFRNYWEADTFKKQMREMGVRDAWIVPFRDGKRVDIKDVMADVSQEPQ